MIFLVDKKFDFSFYLLVHRSEFFSLSFFYNYFGFFSYVLDYDVCDVDAIFLGNILI